MPAHRTLGVALTVVLLTGLATLSIDRFGGMVPGHPDGAVLVTWTSGGLPPGFGSAVADVDTVVAASIVRGDTVGLAASWDADGNPVDQPPAGMTIPLDALAVDPEAHASVLDSAQRDPVAGLSQGEALLGESSARLRGLGEGAVLELASGQRLTVTGVVPDDLVAHAEVMVPAPTQEVPTERFMRIVHTGDRDEVEASIRAAAGDKAPHVRGPGEQRVLRHGGSLLPQVAIKERFGEFAYRPAEGRMIVPDADWVDEHIQVTSVPILGEVACHRELVPALEGAMTELAEAGLSALVDPADYAGCYGPRLIAPGQGLSRHAWGVAVDLNATTNAYGDPPTIDHRVVEAMDRWGFTWGGTWLVPDGMHFEYLPERW